MHTAKSAPGDRGSSHPDRCGYEHRPERCLRVPDRARLSTRFGRSPEVEAKNEREKREGAQGAPSVGRCPFPLSGTG